MRKSTALAEMETLFLALADKTRLRLLNLMREREVCVYLFTEVLSEGQPKISRHLAYLRNAGIVEARRDGKWMYYRIITPRHKFAEFILNDVLDWLKTQDEMREDVSKLAIISGLPENSDIKNPKPNDDIFAQANTSAAKKELEIFLL